MKTTDFTRTLAITFLAMFISIFSMANNSLNTNTAPSRTDNNITTLQAAPAIEYSYLRFDVTKYMNEGDEMDMAHNTLDYLRFDVNKYVETNVNNEMPVENEFGYLQFNVSNYTSTETEEMPDQQTKLFGNLRFDVSNYYSSSDTIDTEIL